MSTEEKRYRMVTAPLGRYAPQIGWTYVIDGTTWKSAVFALDGPSEKRLLINLRLVELPGGEEITYVFTTEIEPEWLGRHFEVVEEEPKRLKIFVGLNYRGEDVPGGLGGRTMRFLRDDEIDCPAYDFTRWMVADPFDGYAYWLGSDHNYATEEDTFEFKRVPAAKEET